jgi:hypothetical protein
MIMRSTAAISATSIPALSKSAVPPGPTRAKNAVPKAPSLDGVEHTRAGADLFGGGGAKDEVEDRDEHQTGADPDHQRRCGQRPRAEAVAPVDDGQPQCEQANDGGGEAELSIHNSTIIGKAIVSS